MKSGNRGRWRPVDSVIQGRQENVPRETAWHLFRHGQNESSPTFSTTPSPRSNMACPPSSQIFFPAVTGSSRICVKFCGLEPRGSPSRLCISEERGSRILYGRMEVAGSRCVVFCLGLTAMSFSSALKISFRRAENTRHTLIPRRLKLTDACLYVISSEDVLLLNGVTMGTF